MISVIIPVVNEEKTIQQLLTGLLKMRGDFEVIVVDGGSEDSTREIVKSFRRVILVDSQRGRGRGVQQNAGARIAKGDVLLFLHADTILPKNAFLLMRRMGRDYEWGAFFKDFDKKNLFLRLVCLRANLVRLLLFHLPFGDQAIFVRRKVFREVGGYPSIPIMEDFELSKKLRRKGKPYIIREKVITSSRKFLENGPIRTYLKMGLIRVLYFFGVSAERIYGMYYKSIDFHQSMTGGRSPA